MLNRPLVRYVVRKLFPNPGTIQSYGPGHEYSDLLQSGRMGLWYACARRDPTRNDKEWQSYAYKCIHGFVMLALREAGKDRFKEEVGRWPRMLSVDFSLTKKESAFDGPHAYNSRDTRLAKAALSELEEVQHALGNRSWWNIDEAGVGEKAMLSVALKQLPERLQTIIEARMDGESLEAVGEKLGITRERARQLQKMALSRLFYLFHHRAANAEDIHEMSHALAPWST